MTEKLHSFQKRFKREFFLYTYLRIPFNLNTNKLETATERLLTACWDCCLLSVSLSRGFIIQSRGEDRIGKQSEGNFPQKSISRIQTNNIYISIVCKYNIKLLREYQAARLTPVNVINHVVDCYSLLLCWLFSTFILRCHS